jgi:hypothetical protein
VEAWIEGEGEAKRSPSVQGRVDPLGRNEIISTHDQILGGSAGQVFLGSTFPAHESYRLQVQEAGAKVGEVLRDQGALGRYGVDFVSVRDGDGWRHHAIEINLRKGGTTHTFRVLQFLTDGHYDIETGLYRTAEGEPRYYHASDNVTSPDYERFTPHDLLDVAVEHERNFHAATQRFRVKTERFARLESGVGTGCNGSRSSAKTISQRSTRVLRASRRDAQARRQNRCHPQLSRPPSTSRTLCR